MELTDRTKIAVGLLFFAGLVVTVVVMDRLTTFPPPPVPVIPADGGASTGPAAPAVSAVSAPPPAAAIPPQNNLQAALPAPDPEALKQEALQRVNDAARDAELKKLRGPGSNSATSGAAAGNPLAYQEAMRHLQQVETAAVKASIIIPEIRAAETAGIDRARAEVEAERVAAEQEAIDRVARRQQEEELHYAELLKHHREREQSPQAEPPAGIEPQKSAPALPPGMTREKKP